MPLKQGAGVVWRGGGSKTAPAVRACQSEERWMPRRGARGTTLDQVKPHERCRGFLQGAGGRQAQVPVVISARTRDGVSKDTKRKGL